MWILSTFNPWFQKKVLKENLQLYGEDKVIQIKKSRFFLWTKILIPFSFWTILVVAWVIFSLSKIHVIRFLWSMIILMIFLWFIPFTKVVTYYLDYKMDFIIVTPRSFLRYDQDWFFKTVSKTIDLKKIRSISVRKSWLFSSIFNDWTLVILSEWWESEKEEDMRAWEITFNNLYNPELYNERINDLLSTVFGK